MGYMVVDRVAERCRCTFDEQRYRADLARTTRGGQPLVLVKPRTFMNASGSSVGLVAAALCAPDLSDLLLVVDDVYLDFGRLRLRRGGGDGGHNGVASVIANVGTTDVPRLRVGIGGAECDNRVEYVLGRFTEQEMGELPDIIAKAGDAVLAWFYKGIDAAMNQVNVPTSEEDHEL